MTARMFSSTHDAPHDIVDRELVCTLELAEAIHLREQIAAYAQSHPGSGSQAWPVAGGVAALTERRRLGRKLNHVTGVGTQAALDREVLSTLEQAFFARRTPLEIDVCPHALPATLNVLGQRGYRVNAFANMYFCVLRNGLTQRAPSAAATCLPIEVRRVRADEQRAFVEWSADGFAAQPSPRPRELLSALASGATARRDTMLFVAEVDGQIAGTAGLSLLDTGRGLVAHLALASTHVQARAASRGIR